MVPLFNAELLLSRDVEVLRMKGVHANGALQLACDWALPIIRPRALGHTTSDALGVLPMLCLVDVCSELDAICSHLRRHHVIALRCVYALPLVDISSLLGC